MVEGILLMADDYSEGQEVFFFFKVGLVAGPNQAEYRAVWW